MSENKDHITDRIIIDFINNNHVMTICTQSLRDDSHTELGLGKGLWCANCFYVPSMEITQMPDLYFMSADHSLHSVNISMFPNVAGTIAVQTLVISEIQGIQFQANVVRLLEQDANYNQALSLYQNRFEIAKKITQPLWTLRFEKIKHTRNSPVFGSKIIWSRDK
ncbi:hypothetical protein [Thorsellia anophelis]|uniref:Pyridoxamine 5'-phosphate oxidase n=1 Tax=Thorsellia anophelis DSM 18579 TaxID=1123402 RepID=A0A1I0CKK1_9GAMM|nr:hypothetical protein [Thorsellia anophelis]SET19958.1 hypothetical protein SAMN02583745_01652 [Thorsellia anophelis DSM 18579]